MKKLYIILIVTLGFLLAPTMTFACGKHPVNHSSTKKAFKTEKADCCPNGKHQGNDHGNCDKKCSHSYCGCTSMFTGGIPLSNDSGIKEITPNVISKKQQFYYPENPLATGFNFLWLIPKIG